MSEAIRAILIGAPLPPFELELLVVDVDVLDEEPQAARVSPRAIAPAPMMACFANDCFINSAPRDSCCSFEHVAEARHLLYICQIFFPFFLAGLSMALEGCSLVTAALSASPK